MATKAAKNQLAEKAKKVAPVQAAKKVAPVQAAKKVAPVQAVKTAPKRKVISKTAASFATKASKKQPVRPLRGDEPNDETAQVLRESLEGKNLVRFESLEAMFADLEI
jgi:hypothetical protein